MAVQWREKLSLLQNATYLCQSEDAFIALDFHLKEALSAFDSSLYIDSGLCKEAVQKNKKGCKQHKKTTQSKRIIIEENMKWKKRSQKEEDKDFHWSYKRKNL